MKKIICVLLAMMLLFTCVSCNREKPEVTDTRSANAEKTETTSNLPDVEKATPVYYPSVKPFSESPTRVLYTSSGTIRYTNKITGEDAVFCFDPLCEHKNPATCIAQKFFRSGTMQTIEYCQEDNRFYALRGDQFCSFAFDGSDLRVVHSYGEEGQFDDDHLYDYIYGSLFFLQVKGPFVFFVHRHAETGKLELIRYDVKKKAFSTVFYEKDTSVDGYDLAEDCLYLHLVGDKTGLYRVGFGGENIEKISDTVMQYTAQHSIFDGETLYYVKRKIDPNAFTNADAIAAFSVKTGEETVLYPITEEVDHCYLLADTRDYLYFTLHDRVVIESYETEYGILNEVNPCSKIFRLDKRDGTVLTVFDDLYYGTQNIYFTGNTVHVIGWTYQQVGQRKMMCNDSFILTIGEDGFFYHP